MSSRPKPMIFSSGWILFALVRRNVLVTSSISGMRNFIRDNQEERACESFAPSRHGYQSSTFLPGSFSQKRKEQETKKDEKKKKQKKKTLTREVHLVGKERINPALTRNGINRTLHHAAARLADVIPPLLEPVWGREMDRECPII